MASSHSATPRPLERGLIVGIVMLVLLLVISGLVSLRNVWKLDEDASWVAHTHEVIGELEDVIASAADAETGQRGYLLTGKAIYLEPYNRAVAAINGEVDRFAELTRDNDDQQGRIPELRRLVAARFGTLKELMVARDEGGLEAAQQLMQTDKGKQEMDALRVLVDEMQTHEEELLNQRAETTKAAYRWTRNSGIVTMLLGVMSVGAFGWLMKRHLDARAKGAATLWLEREQFRMTLASIGDAVVTTDTQARVKFMNAVAESLTGWTTRKARERPADDARDKPLAEVMRMINEYTREPAVNPVDRVLAEGVIVGLANHTLLVRKDGVETPIDDSAAPIRNIDGKLTGCVLVFRDITERKKADAEINRLLASERQRAAQLKRLSEAAVTLNSATTRDSVMGVVTAEAKLVFGAEDAQVLLNGAAGHPTGRGLAAPMIARSGQPFGYLTLVATPDRQFTADDESILTQLAHMAAVAVQNAELYEELRESSERKNEFLATLAHELRNPLAPIRNSLTLMQAAEQDAKLAEECRTIIERQVVQMVRLIDDLLDVSRISRGKIELRKESVELQSVISAAVEASRPLIEANRHQLKADIPAESIRVHGDPTRLAQVVLNLLNNAAKYTNPGGEIRLSVEPAGTEAVIHVRDNGIGIPAEMLGQVFEMFTQVDRSLERSQGGLGIGLTLVQRMVDMHGGRVEARSEGEGKGSEFIVRIPLSVGGTTRPDSAAPKSAQSESQKKTWRILAVDDNRDAVNSLAMMLRLMGHEVQTAYDGLEAVDAAANVKPDVVLLDIGLPRLNGYDVARRIRQSERGKEIRLIAITGWGQEEDRRMSQEAGFDFHLVKPVDPTALDQLLDGIDR